MWPQSTWTGDKFLGRSDRRPVMFQTLQEPHSSMMASWGGFPSTTGLKETPACERPPVSDARMVSSGFADTLEDLGRVCPDLEAPSNAATLPTSGSRRVVEVAFWTISHRIGAHLQMSVANLMVEMGKTSWYHSRLTSWSRALRPTLTWPDSSHVHSSLTSLTKRRMWPDSPVAQATAVCPWACKLDTDKFEMSPTASR